MVAVTSEITNPEACIIREMVAECQKHSFQGMRFETTTQRMVVKLLQYYSSIVPEAWKEWLKKIKKEKGNTAHWKHEVIREFV